MGSKKVLWIGDGVAPTGFSQVNMNIIQNLPEEEFEVHHLAINYKGDPHDYHWKIYPASGAHPADLWGFRRLPDFATGKWDAIFILNDIWVVDKYLGYIKEHFKNDTPPIIVYFPIDAKDLDPAWFKNFDIVSRAVTYTQFGRTEVEKSVRNLFPEVIPHGVDTSKYYKLEGSKEELKSRIFPNRDDFLDSFIVLNANRNQPRKRIDLTLEGFALFAKDKPLNVKLYTHCGLKDVGLDIVKLAFRLGIDNRLIVSNSSGFIQSVTEERLNEIYNASDVGINTSIGEGWGLTNHEHAATGAPQIVPDHSACRELYDDCGSLIPVKYELRNMDSLTVSGYVTPEDVAAKIQELYVNRELFERNSIKCFNKFTSKEYTWPYIVENQWIPLFKEIFQ